MLKWGLIVSRKKKICHHFCLTSQFLHTELDMFSLQTCEYTSLTGYTSCDLMTFAIHGEGNTWEINHGSQNVLGVLTCVGGY